MGEEDLWASEGSPEYEASEGVYGDYQDDDDEAVVVKSQEMTGPAQTLYEAMLSTFAYANELLQYPFDEVLEEKPTTAQDAPLKCADPEVGLISLLPRTADDCERFFDEEKSFVPGSSMFVAHDTLHTKKEEAINLCRTALDGITIHGSFRVYVNYGIKRGVAVGSAVSTNQEEQTIQEEPIAWAFDMRLFKALDPTSTAVTEEILYLRILKASDYPDSFEKVTTTASLFENIMQDPTPRNTPGWSVLRLAFADANGSSVGLAEYFSELPPAAHEGINKLFGAHDSVWVRHASTPFGLGSGRPSEKAYESATELDVLTLDTSGFPGQRVKMLLMVYGHHTGVVDMNFFIQKRGCSHTEEVEQLTEQTSEEESTLSLTIKNILSLPVVITLVVILLMAGLIVAYRLRHATKPPVKKTPVNFIESVVEPLVLEYVITVMSKPQMPKQ